MHTQVGYISPAYRIPNAMSEDEEHVCDCGATFDTLEELKQHAEEHHSDD
jgi:hypothetical protein